MTFPEKVVRAVDQSKILGIRAGTKPHRIIGVWPIVVEGRIFIRSWGVKPEGWYRAFVKEPRGVMEIGGRKYSVRAVRTRSERLKDAVDRAYAEKYNTPSSMKYVRDLCKPKCRDTTTELVPANANRARSSR